MEPFAKPCVYELRPNAASASLPRAYRPRQPQRTVLHCIVRENLETFLAEGRAHSASWECYPYYVEKERERAALALLVQEPRAVSVVHDEAAYLVDMVLPQAPYRQWTLTFPFPIRTLMARDYKLVTEVLGVAIRVLLAWQRRQARRAGYAGAQSAAVTFVQRFGGAMNANLHLHVLLPDGVFVLSEDQTFKLVTLPPPEDEDVLCLVQRVGRRVRALVERRYGAVDDGDGDVLEGAIDEAMRSIPTVSFDDASDDEVPEGDGPQVRRSRRCASVDGFSIHAKTAVATDNRVGLEHLCRYGMRPPFSHERLSISSDGKVLLGLRRPWPKAGGVSTRYFEPVQFRVLAP